MNNDEDRIADPTIGLDMRLTRTEWTIYWKTRYESNLKRMVDMQGAAKRVGQAFSESENENKKLKAKIAVLQLEESKVVRAKNAGKFKKKKKKGRSLRVAK